MCQNELQNTALIDGVCQVVQARHDDDAEGDGDDDGDGDNDNDNGDDHNYDDRRVMKAVAAMTTTIMAAITAITTCDIKTAARPTISESA